MVSFIRRYEKREMRGEKEGPQRDQTMSFRDLIGFLSLYFFFILFAHGYSLARLTVSAQSTNK